MEVVKPLLTKTFNAFLLSGHGEELSKILISSVEYKGTDIAPPDDMEKTPNPFHSESYTVLDVINYLLVKNGEEKLEIKKKSGKIEQFIEQKGLKICHH